MLGALQPAVRRACESVMLVGTFPPTECGIATYTANLRDGMETCGLDSKVLRLVDETEVGTESTLAFIGTVHAAEVLAASSSAARSNFRSSSR